MASPRCPQDTPGRGACFSSLPRSQELRLGPSAAAWVVVMISQTPSGTRGSSWGLFSCLSSGSATSFLRLPWFRGKIHVKRLSAMIVPSLHHPEVGAGGTPERAGPRRQGGRGRPRKFPGGAGVWGGHGPGGGLEAPCGWSGPGSTGMQGLREAREGVPPGPDNTGQPPRAASGPLGITAPLLDRDFWKSSWGGPWRRAGGRGLQARPTTAGDREGEAPRRAACAHTLQDFRPWVPGSGLPLPPRPPAGAASCPPSSRAGGGAWDSSGMQPSPGC